MQNLCRKSLSKIELVQIQMFALIYLGDLFVWNFLFSFSHQFDEKKPLLKFRS